MLARLRSSLLTDAVLSLMPLAKASAPLTLSSFAPSSSPRALKGNTSSSLEARICENVNLHLSQHYRLDIEGGRAND